MSRRKLVANAVTHKLLESDVLNRSAPIHGERTLANRRVGVATTSTRRRTVLAIAPALAASRLPRLLEMNRVAAAGRAIWVRVPKIATAIAKSDTWPICDRFRILKRRM